MRQKSRTDRVGRGAAHRVVERGAQHPRSAAVAYSVDLSRKVDYNRCLTAVPSVWSPAASASQALKQAPLSLQHMGCALARAVKHSSRGTWQPHLQRPTLAERPCTAACKQHLAWAAVGSAYMPQPRDIACLLPLPCLAVWRAAPCGATVGSVQCDAARPSMQSGAVHAPPAYPACHFSSKAGRASSLLHGRRA